MKVRNSILRRVLFHHLIDIGENNVSGPQADPHIDFAWIGSSPSMREKTFFRSLKLGFLQSLSFLQAIGENNVSGPHVYPHIDLTWIGSSPSSPSSDLRVWQSYSRVPQTLKVLCVWYSCKYAARLGFEPLNFLCSEFLYNTQAVFGGRGFHRD